MQRTQFDAPRFAEDLRRALRAAPRGTRRTLEQLTAKSSFQRILEGQEPRVAHIATVCDYMGWHLHDYLRRAGDRRRDYIHI